MSFVAHNIVYENNIIKSCILVDGRNSTQKFFQVTYDTDKYTTKEIKNPFTNNTIDENDNDSNRSLRVSSQANKNIVSNQIKTVKDLDDFKNTFGQGISLNE